MPVSIAPRQPKLLTVDQRCPSAEMSVGGNKAGIKNEPAPKKHTVKFYEIVSIRSTTHVNDMTDEEIENAWFSRREMLGIKRTMATEVKHMALGKQIENSTTRGLEYRTREGSDRRRSNKLTSIHAVLDEQDLQHMRGVNDPEGLRKVYLKHSTHCLADARQLGNADEIEMMQQVQEDEEQTNTQSEEHEEEMRVSKKDNRFLRLFAKKKAVVEEIKQLKLSAVCA